MVARRARLDHPRLAFREEPGQQHGALHLGARHRHAIPDPLQVPAADGERRVAVGGTSDQSCAHLPQWFDDPPHRAAAQRRVPGHDAGERLSGQDPRQQAHGGARAATIQHVSRLLQPARPGAVDHQLFGAQFVDGHPQCAHAVQRGVAVRCRQPAADVGVALRQRAKQQRPVADRFVARHRNRAAQGWGSTNNQLRHVISNR